MAQSQQEENHWPGFVDALSTIVMVVTFLLIILAIAIFVMSLKIAETTANIETEARVGAATTNVERSEKVEVDENPVQTETGASTASVTELNERFLLTFSDLTVSVDDAAKARMGAFVERNGVLESGRRLVVTSYFGAGTSYTKAQRVAYYRLLSVRGSLAESGMAIDAMSIFVKEAPSTELEGVVEVALE
ncbi:MAG: hypothetical protein AAFX08_04985 [Pseudomonadota bacterium]